MPEPTKWINLLIVRTITSDVSISFWFNRIYCTLSFANRGQNCVQEIGHKPDMGQILKSHEQMKYVSFYAHLLSKET